MILDRGLVVLNVMIGRLLVLKLAFSFELGLSLFLYGLNRLWCWMFDIGYRLQAYAVFYWLS